MDDDLSDEERSAQVRGVLLKALAVLVVVGALIWIGTTVMVRALDLDEAGGGPVGSAPAEPVEPLPTTALPGPDDESTEPGEPEMSEAAKPEGKQGDIELSVSPLEAKPMERVNLTGTYEGADNQQLEVQRFNDGTWTNFGVQAEVRVGKFATYIMTGRTGENRFRVFDPKTEKGSNVVLVTIG